MTSPWKPAAFKDTYRADLMRRIQEKIRKKQTHDLSDEEPPRTEKPKAQVIDLMEALRNSLKSGARKPARRAARSTARSRKSA
jgi:DNA end-binding protein Ku